MGPEVNEKATISWLNQARDLVPCYPSCNSRWGKEECDCDSRIVKQLILTAIEEING